MSVHSFLKSLFAAAPRPTSRRRPPTSRLSLDALEDRSVPASVLVHTDIDGDRITFRSSLGNLSGKITFGGELGRLHNVYSVNLSDPSFSGTNFSVSVAKAKTGDGQAVVGYINGGSNNLGVVKLAADLGDINAGSGLGTVPALKSLTVDSFGRFGQVGTGGGYASVNGDVGALVVKHDFIATNFIVTGTINTVQIGGSLIGGDGYGQIYASVDLGKVTIRGDLRGGNGVYTGTVGAGHDVARVTVGGSIYGGKGDNSGSVFAAFTQPGEIGLVRVNGSLIGGQGHSSGAIGGDNAAFQTKPVSLGTVLIGKDIIGGGGISSGTVDANFGTLDSLTVRGSVIGGSGDYSGDIVANDKVSKVVIFGRIYGGSGTRSGQVYGGNGITFLNIRGDVRGGSGIDSGSVECIGPGITTKIIGGAIIPGTGAGSGKVTG